MNEESTQALELQRLTKRYGKQIGIEDLDLTVPRGEVFGFLGPNGSGKTTTIRLLLGLIHPTSGNSRILGQDCRRAGPGVRASVGYIPGDLATYDRMRGRQFLAYLGRLRGGVAPENYEDLADRFHVDLNRRLRELSKGNRQKVGVIQAFMHRPAILILDEPTSGLDPLVQQEFQELVRQTVAEGATVFLSSHVLAEVEQMADRVGVVKEGHLVAVDSVDALRERAARLVELDFPAAPPEALRTADGVRSVLFRGATAECMVTGGIGPLLKVAVDHGVVDVHTHDPDLEDSFLGIVAGGERS